MKRFLSIGSSVLQVIQLYISIQTWHACNAAGQGLLNVQGPETRVENFLLRGETRINMFEFQDQDMNSPERKKNNYCTMSRE